MLVLPVHFGYFDITCEKASVPFTEGIFLTYIGSLNVRNQRRVKTRLTQLPINRSGSRQNEARVWGHANSLPAKRSKSVLPVSDTEMLFAPCSSHQYCSRERQRVKTLRLSPWWALAHGRMSHASVQFRAAVRLYMSFWGWSKCCCFLLAPQSPWKPALKVRDVEAQSVDPCWSLSMHLKAPPVCAVQPCDRPALQCSGPEALTGEGFISCDTVTFTTTPALRSSPDLSAQRSIMLTFLTSHSLSSDLSLSLCLDAGDSRLSNTATQHRLHFKS